MAATEEKQARFATAIPKSDQILTQNAETLG